MVADVEILQAETSGQRFSDWLEAAPIKRTAARELLQGLGIEPLKVRVPGVSAKVAWLTPEQIQAMDAAVARVQAGETVAEVCAAADAPPAEPGMVAAPVRKPSRPDADTLAAMLGAVLQLQQQAPPSPLARARMLREVVAEGLALSTSELAEVLGRSVESLARLRGGQRVAGYRVWRVEGGATDPETYWRLTDPSGSRVPGDPRRAPVRDQSQPDAD
jgi:hypothetical protein